MKSSEELKQDLDDLDELIDKKKPLTGEERQRLKNIRDKGLLANLRQGAIRGTPIKQTISDQFKARVTGIREKFHPLNVTKMFIGRTGATLLGKTFGIDKSTLKYFTGDPKKASISPGTGNKVGNIDTAFYTSVAEDQKQRLRKGDGIANVAGKILNLFKFHGQQNRLMKEINHNFEAEKHDKEKKRHKELLEAIKSLPQQEPDLGKVKFKGKAAARTRMSARKSERLPREDKPKINTTTKTKPPPETPTTSKVPSIPGLTPRSLAIGGAIAAAGTIGLITKEEGYASKAYNDAGKVSIGYGHQIKQEEYAQGFIQAGDERIPIIGNRGLDTKITKEQAQKLLQVDLPKYTDVAKKQLGDSTWNKLNENQKAALADYTYNVGSLAGLHGLKDAIDSGDTKRAAEIIKNGIATAQGRPNAVLKARRAREAALFASTSTTTSAPPPTPPQGETLNKQSTENKDLKGSNKNTNIAINNSKLQIDTGGKPSTQVLDTGIILDFPLFMTA